ncbi:type II toxin-antitoxin system prevent-host-death family antitoxin [Candidatus Peregrinibacteria bacterium]|nr:type II toxin-antitoxin system prevent-host-death family antitoxin [Candidatus Peregrinibacteria bacterium]
MTPTTLSATKAKLRFGTVMMQVKDGKPVIIEKNNDPQIVWISIDDYEDFLELKDTKFQKGIEKNAHEMKKGKFGTLDTLHSIHQKTIKKEAREKKEIS